MNKTSNYSINLISKNRPYWYECVKRMLTYFDSCKIWGSYYVWTTQNRYVNLSSYQVKTYTSIKDISSLNSLEKTFPCLSKSIFPFWKLDIWHFIFISLTCIRYFLFLLLFEQMYYHCAIFIFLSSFPGHQDSVQRYWAWFILQRHDNK